jgi:tetratricopeptide (TPR) repeat protein
VATALGLLYYDLKKYDQAAGEFARLLEKNPGDDKLRYLLASALEQKGDPAAAKTEYQKVSPTSDLFSNAQMHTAMILKKEGKPAEAVAVLSRAIARKGDDAILYLYLSSSYEEIKDLPAAEKTVLEGLGRFPRNADLHYILGTLQEKTNRFEESILSMQKALEIDPKNADALNFIGYSYADRGIHLEEAERLIVEALKIKPDNGYILDSLGWVHFRRNKIESALQHLKRALELLPADANIMEHLGDVYQKIGRNQEALEYYRKAAAIDPGNKALKKKLDILTDKKNKTP